MSQEKMQDAKSSQERNDKVAQMCQYGECESDASVEFKESGELFCNLHAFGLLSKQLEDIDVSQALYWTMDRADYGKAIQMFEQSSSGSE
jgi:hypothetical protein